MNANPPNSSQRSESFPNHSSALEKSCRKIGKVILTPPGVAGYCADDPSTFTRKLEWCPFAQPALAGGAAARDRDALVERRRNLPDEPASRPARALPHAMGRLSALPGETHDTIRETDPAADSSDTKEVSKEEGGLTGLRHIWKRTLGPRSPRRRGSESS